MEVQANIKNVRLSPKKIRFIVDDVKRKTVAQALTSLHADSRRSALVLYKAIKSAADSAQKIHGVDVSRLTFKEVSVDEGPSLRRMRPVSKGRAHFFKKRSSHINIVLVGAAAAPSKKIQTQSKLKPVEKKEIETQVKQLPVAKTKKAKSTK